MSKEQMGMRKRMDFCTAGFGSIEREFYTYRKNQWKTREKFGAVSPVFF
ncbi:hypothetical protein LEP1GSC202_3057 [Leptospira yanagawae serovar Saopaulo str. Sao Paulo = ATCC 700523]|uniref:Uncharacterized protein n=1 Tax=Leptospira yanagawae serovar Saopaulo str. Sao Paulo = ATCC 700523 TaxID=1249483 RepID=A0A5E8HAS5_9LEPT|nr:hypothetical protein LEP1GSC202_3057 [Leptospira yanagawae serovar Saopaulo str. Sao Paulo = ATCC 700523]